MTSIPASRTAASDRRPATSRVFMAVVTVLAAVVVGMASLLASPASATPLSRAKAASGSSASPAASMSGPTRAFWLVRVGSGRLVTTRSWWVRVLPQKPQPAGAKYFLTLRLLRLKEPLELS